MLIPIEGVGQYGVMKDLLKRDLPLQVWTDARNVAFRRNYIQKTMGQHNILTPVVAPYALFSCPYLTSNYWVYLGLAEAHAFLGTTQAEITNVGGDYTGGLYDLWNGGIFNGIPYFNNGVDKPQVWNTPGLGTALVDLPNWPANTTAKVVRDFKAYMVALDVTLSGARDRRKVKWSHTADAGSLPSSWDHTDTTKDAGEVSLSEGRDGIVDALPLGDVNVIYTELMTWAMRFIGGTYMFDFHPIFHSSGLLAQGCAAQFLNKHFVVTQDDIVVHDGTNIESVIDQRLREWFFANLNSSTYFLTRVVPFKRLHEMWVCFPTAGGALDTALIWNWRTNTWTLRDLPLVRAIASSLHSPTYSIDLWESESVLTWDIETEKEWGDALSDKLVESILCSPINTTGILRVRDDLRQFAGSNFTSYVERKGIAAIGLDRDGRVATDTGRQKLLLEVWPKVEAAAGTTINVYVGAHEKPDGDDVVWKPPKVFTVGTDVKVPAYTSGRYLAVKFEDQGSADWKMSGYDLDIAPLGVL